MKISLLLFSGYLAFLQIGKAILCRIEEAPKNPNIEKNEVLNKVI
jgi:hypothetical protein